MQTFTEQFYVNEETFALVSQILFPEFFLYLTTLSALQNQNDLSISFGDIPDMVTNPAI